MGNNSKIYEIAILAKATWNLHSLNNEGTVGNVTEPRTIVLADGTKTDGISGEMLKHIHAQNLWVLEGDKNKLCESCKNLEPMRADGSKVVRGEKTPSGAVKKSLKGCMICDLHGFLVQKPTVARPSTVEFGWALGVPQVHRDIHLHARHAVGEKAKPTKEEQQNQKEERPETAQMVYHRPTRSGVYAIISIFAPWRIGLNNVNYDYEIDQDIRKQRYLLALRAYQGMFSRPDGAMTSTRLPHSDGFEGLVVISRTNFPVPVISPLKQTYQEEMEKIAQKISGLEIQKFGDLSGFVEKLDNISNSDLYTLIKPEEKKKI